MELDKRTELFRQHLGLLVSHYWNQASSKDDMQDPVRLVSRHLQQYSANGPSGGSQGVSSITGVEKSLMEQEKELTLEKTTGQSSKKRRHPGYIPLSILSQKDSSTSNPPTNNNTASQEIFFPTCKTCFGPIHPGSSTTTNIRIESSKQSNAHLSKAQKRSRRRHRKQLYKDAEQRSKKAKTQHSTQDFAEWYRYAQEMNPCTNRSMVCDPNHSVLRFSCKNCLTPTSIHLAKPLLSSSLSEKKKPAKRPSIFSNATPANTRKSSLSKEPSKPTKKNHVGDDYIAFDKPPRAVMQSAVKPKKKKGKKKKGGGGSQLRDFLSSLNDH